MIATSRPNHLPREFVSALRQSISKALMQVTDALVGSISSGRLQRV
uniref:Uncharacterized protein n=1 Tax=Picea glauca TaxID=3330 RepID=A0A101M3G4_PICGL|nr:hypothetical protein ABT39_MTgene194 [Picea glauca]